MSNLSPDYYKTIGIGLLEKRKTADKYGRRAIDNIINCSALLHKLRYESPKLGNNDDYVDSIAVDLLDSFAFALKDRKNERKGVFRAGTGSAMYYLWHANEIGASPDDRLAGEPLMQPDFLLKLCKNSAALIFA